MRVAPPRTTKTPSPGKWNGNREAHRADCVRIVHLLRHSLEFVAYKDRKAVAAALKDIYRAVDATAAEAALSAFEDGPWGRKYAAIGQSWRRELATGLGRGGAVLCLPGRGASAAIHDQCYRGPELEAPPRGPNPGSLPDRRGGAEVVVLGLEPVGERVDHAGP